MDTQNDILLKEEKFHDEWAKLQNIDKVLVDEFFEAATKPENRYLLRSLGEIKNKKLLELGCGLGEGSVYLAKQGANVIASDISQGMLDITKEVAKRHGVSLDTVKCLSDKIPFEDETFDIIYLVDMLHHVDIENTLKEASRVLKKGGIFVCSEPLAHNPIINVYRKIAKDVRSEDEHPIKMNELKIFKKYFNNIKYDTFWLFTNLVFLKYYFIDKVNPNEERYWKKIIYDVKSIESLYLKLEKIDRIFLKIFPFMKRYCWTIAIVAQK